MTDIAAFFAPTALPAVAGAVVAANAQGTQSVQGDAFAALLSEFETAVGLTTGQLPNGKATTAPAVEGKTTQGDIQPSPVAILANGGDAPAVNPDATLTAQLAAMQAALQALQVQPATTAAVTAVNDVQTKQSAVTQLGLRGTIVVVEADQTAAQPKADAVVTAAATGQQALPPELLAALNNQKPNVTSQAPHAKKTELKSATAPAQTDTAPLLQPAAVDHAAKTVENGSGNASFQSNTNAGTLAQQPTNQNTTAPAANPQAFAVAAAPAQAVIDTPKVTMTMAPTPQTPVPLDALAVNIARKVEAGVSQFDITLHPAELGKLEISLSVADDGRIHAALRAERPETLDLLQRDARQLESQLRQAGLDVGSNSLSFSLSQGNGQQRHQPFVGWPAFADAQAAAGAAKEQALTAYVTVRDRDGVDIRV
ncbi:MAG: flagellar hook-length control protein FliK [Alphaproteobacteria bacterium]|nr:flagellar hook-length control protein FliK [Alphaproteobacteria bacterium]